MTKDPKFPETRCQNDETEVPVALLLDPPERAEWWTVLQAIMWLEMDPRTLEQVALAVEEDVDDVTPLAAIWDKIDFCAQAVLTQSTATFDAELLRRELA